MLVEALAAVALIAVGVVAATKCLGGMAQARTRAADAEEMQRLAFRKYDEILAEQSLSTGEASGDFADVGESRFTWQASRTALGIGNLDSLRIEVTTRGDPRQTAEVQGLVCRPGGKS